MTRLTESAANQRNRQLAAEYAAGETMDVIAHRHGVSKSTVRYAVNTYGVKMRSSGRKPNPLKPAPKKIHVTECCGRRTIPIEHHATGEIVRFTCRFCWKDYSV